jgi:hypothetical protein
VVDEGWMLFQAVAKPRLDVTYTPPDPSVIDSLDAWENKWFPIAQASLRRHFPRVAERVFRNLTQTEGPDVIVSVSTFIERYDTLTGTGNVADTDGAAARQLLASRGLTPAVIDSARAQVRSLGQLVPVTVHDTDELQERSRVAEEELWGWYLEWSRIIRTAVKDRRLLQQLGFLARRGGRLVEVTDEEGVTDDGEVSSGNGGAPHTTSSNGASNGTAATPSGSV